MYQINVVLYVGTFLFIVMNFHVVIIDEHE